MITLKFKKLHENAIVPQYKTKGSVGFDFHSLHDFTLSSQGRTMCQTGVAVEVPEGYELTVRARSGLSKNFPNYFSIGIGTIDYDYRGEILIPMYNHDPFNNFVIKAGDRVAQGVVSPIVRPAILLVDKLSDTERGEGGFGSTGK